MRRWSLSPLHLTWLAGLFFGVLHPATALAFVRTRTCDFEGSADTKVCAPSQEPRAVYWASTCLTYYINREGSEDFGGLTQLLLEAVDASFQAWAEPECSGVRFVRGGETCNKNVGREDTNITGGNQNLVIWRDETWEYASDAIAVTTVSPDPDTGEILDADIELNGVNFFFTELSAPNDAFVDVRNTLTHEVGHFIGFGHETTIPEATMYPDADGGEIIKRTLHEDDISGLCQVYPNMGSNAVCTPAPITDYTCTLEYTSELSCTSAPSHDAPRHTTVVLLVLGGLGLWRRRRRRDRARGA